MSVGRRADFLGQLHVRVVGDTAASDTVVAVLSALGAGVERTAAIDADLSGVDVVVVDRIAEGVDASYLEQVQDLLASQDGGVRTWVTVSTFGLDGPHSWYRGSELVAAAAGCLLAAVTDAAGGVHPMPADQALRNVGQAAALAVLQGLSQSRDRGASVHLDVSAQEAVAFATVQQELAHLIYDCPGQSGSARYSAPSRLFECADGLLNVVVLDDHQFARVADVMGRPDWVKDYPTLVERNRHADEINGVVAKWALDRSKAECEQLLQDNAVPATAIRTVAEVLSSDQFVAREWPYDLETTTRTTGVVPALVERQPGRGTPAAGRSLSDLHVVEVTNVLAGPLAGAIIAAMGATVVRLEDPARLDIYRRNGPFADGEPGMERAAYFMAANYDKRSVSDRLVQDPEFVPDIMSWGNVLLENVGSGRLARLGIDASGLGGGVACSVSVSGFGRSGPHSHYRAYAPNVHSYAGLSEAVAAHSDVDVTVRTSMADYCTGMWAATFAAAWWLSGDPDTARVDLSMAEVIASKLLPPANPANAAAPTSGADLIAPIGDGRHLAVTADDVRSVFTALGGHKPDSAIDLSAAAVELISEAAAQDAEATVSALQKAGLAAYIVQTPAMLLADDQTAARGFFAEVDHPVLGRRRIIALPWKEAGQPRKQYRPAPLLGEADVDVERMVRR